MSTCDHSTEIQLCASDPITWWCSTCGAVRTAGNVKSSQRTWHPPNGTEGSVPVYAVRRFLAHMAERGPLYDATHAAEQGDDSHYYELDARVVEPVAAWLVKICTVNTSTKGSDGTPLT